MNNMSSREDFPWTDESKNLKEGLPPNRKRTRQSKGELLKAATGSGQPERQSLAQNREKLYDKFYNNLRLLVATETISMTDLARQLGLQSGTRIANLTYGRGKPEMEEIIVLAKHYKCSIDDILYKTVTIKFE